MPRPLPAVNLSPAERDALEKWAGRRKTAQGLATRARILLLADEGASNKAIAADLALDPATVSKWRNRFLRDRVEGLYDQPRSGAPRRIDDDKVEALVLDTLERRPEGATHWSSRLIAKRHGLSHTSVQRIWHAFGSSRTAPRPSSSPPTPTSSARSAISSGSTSIRRPAP